MNKKLLIAIIAVVILSAIGFIFINSKSVNSTPITLEEISKHNTKESCWTTIKGGVYDVTNFISQHKGGDRILNACGIDATDLFTGKSPMGRLHSRVAIKLLSKMRIGTLQK